ncbi:Protein CBG19030 [Caenorhabditis briggsae]|uniref:Protein CBG19030 n=1 Tax=Caenorhabditis briggsae TaxID=6238 RepID=A8XUL8_CAEBR|nr:Protein CBG19030 [Caenorhabditis briggsae]CAP36343.2 Protein CBG19030 [Caenorhabditis briggsae]
MIPKPRQDSEEKSLDEQLELLQQEKIAELIVTNEATENQLTNLTFESNDVISYLKKLVEEKDEESDHFQTARLEEMLDEQMKESDRKFKNHRENYELEEKKLKEEIEKLKSEMSIMDTQLGNQHRIELEIIEMGAKLNSLQAVVDQQEETIRRKEAEERSVKIAAIEQARADLSAEFEQAVAEIRAEASLESKGHTLMNNQVMEHLELELTRKKQDVLRMEQLLEEKQLELEGEMEKTKEREEENLKLRSLLEKSGQTVSDRISTLQGGAKQECQTEKALKDSKKRLEESENKRKSTMEKYVQIENDLNAKVRGSLLDDALQNVEKSQKVTSLLEDRLLREQQTRKSTIDAHKAQNKKIEELKVFFKDVLSSEEGLLDEVIKENRNAVFAHLALIISRIPIVK